NLEILAQHYSRWHGIAIAALRPQRIVYEGSYEWRFRKFTTDDSAAADSLWAYVDARDVATACLAWVQLDPAGLETFNVAADDVCVRTPTRPLVAGHYAHVTDLRSDLAGCSGLVSCVKLQQMLGWKPAHHWQDMAVESEAQEFALHPPAR